MATLSERAPGSGFLRQSRAFAALDRVAHRAEAAATALFAAISLGYFGFEWFFTTRKLLWNDELYTYYIATQPTMRDVWGALSAGGEQTPPLFYAITRASFGLFGVSDLSIRLPEIFAFWMMSACLYVYVRRSTTALAGLVAATLPLVTSAFPYSYEARPYALVMGFAALALLAWQSIALGRRRTVWIACFALSLAAAVSSHYYGLFAVFPFAAGESARTLQRRRVDAAVWASMVVAVVPLAFHLPLLRTGAAYSSAFWSPPQWVNLPDFYEDLLTPALVPLVTILVVTSLVARRLGPAAAKARTDAAPPWHDLVAASGFVLIPLLAVIAAKVATGAFVNRYAVAAVVGFGALAGFGLAMAFWNRPSLQLMSVAALVGWFGLSQAREAMAPTGASVPVSAASVQRPVEWLANEPEPDLPLVIADPHTFTVLSHYGTSGIRSRLVYAADPKRALKRLGTNSVERGMIDLIGPWFHMNVVPFDGFVATHARFFVYGDFVRLSFLNWIVPELQAQGFHAELLNRAGDNMLLYVSRDAEAETTSAPAPLQPTSAGQNGSR